MLADRLQSPLDRLVDRSPRERHRLQPVHEKRHTCIDQREHAVLLEFAPSKEIFQFDPALFDRANRTSDGLDVSRANVRVTHEIVTEREKSTDDRALRLDVAFDRLNEWHRSISTGRRYSTYGECVLVLMFEIVVSEGSHSLQLRFDRIHPWTEILNAVVKIIEHRQDHFDLLNPKHTRKRMSTVQWFVPNETCCPRVPLFY